MRKWEAERQESTRRWEAEREDRKAEIKLKEAEFGLKKNEAANQWAPYTHQTTVRRS